MVAAYVWCLSDDFRVDRVTQTLAYLPRCCYLTNISMSRLGETNWTNDRQNGPKSAINGATPMPAPLDTTPR